MPVYYCSLANVTGLDIVLDAFRHTMPIVFAANERVYPVVYYLEKALCVESGRAFSLLTITPVDLLKILFIKASPC